MHARYLIDEPTCISFSGGRTSGYMLHQVLEANGGLPDVARVVFAARSAKFGALTTGAAATAEAAVPRGPCAACGTAQPPVSPRILRSAPRTLLLELLDNGQVC